jgi:hypothetical protein
MKRIAAVLGSTALIGALAVGEVAADSAPWIPAEIGDVTHPAGELCEFEVYVDVLHERQFYRNVSTYDDGSPRTQLWKGPMTLRYINTDTGAYVDRDAGGRAIVEYGPDGRYDSATIQTGYLVGGAREGSDPGKGIWYLTGRWSSLVRDDDGPVTVFLGPRGTAENLCETLD